MELYFEHTVSFDSVIFLITEDRAGPFQISGKWKKSQELTVFAGGKTLLLGLSLCQKCGRLQI